MAKKIDKRIDVLPTLSRCEDFEEWKFDVKIWQAVTELEERNKDQYYIDHWRDRLRRCAAI